MTEKRFIETLSTGIVTDNVTGKEYKCEMRIDDDLLELLNELHEENEQLKQQEKRLYKYFRKCFENVSEQGFEESWEVVKKYD